MRKSFSFFVLIGVVCALVAGCEKKDRLYYSPVLTIDKVEIVDMAPVAADKFLVLGKDKDGKSVVYLCSADAGGRYSASKRGSGTLSFKLNTIMFDNGVAWLAGDTLAIRFSTDTCKTLKRWASGSFATWKEKWPRDVSDLKQLYLRDDEPYFAIGSTDLFEGNFYYYCKDWGCWASHQTRFGVNDMIVRDDSVYVAGYGSILFAGGLGEERGFEEIGGENFTGIAANSRYVVACAHSGKLFRSELHSHKWEKVFANGKRLLYVEADDFGNMVAVGESRDVLISNDNGETWRAERYPDGNKISCLKLMNNEFYIGTEKGVVIKLNNTSLQ